VPKSLTQIVKNLVYMACKLNEDKLSFTEFIIVNTAKSLSNKMKVSRN
jgi:hypothetical protein